jgi:hypothetical protein
MNFFKKKTPQKETHMADIVPVRNVEYKHEEDNTITLLKPKFSGKFGMKYITPRMKYPHYHIHLDAIGSTVWKAIDGKLTALEIGEKIKNQMGEKIEPVYERLGMFLAKMKNENFIKW